MFKWKFYCPCCKSIKNRFQVAKGTDHVRYYWHRCRDCGIQVIELEDAIRDAIVSTRKLIDKANKEEPTFKKVAGVQKLRLKDEPNPLIGKEKDNEYTNDPTKVVVDWSELK